MAKTIRTFSNDEKLVAERRRQIINCAIDLFVKNGFDETTIADIAAALGWSKGLIYHYVSTKDDVLYLVANDRAEGTTRGFSDLRDRCKKLSPVQAVLKYIDYYYRVVHNTQNYQVFLNQLAARLPRKDRKILFDADRFALDVLDEILKRGAGGDFHIKDTLLMAYNILLIGRTWADRRWFLQKHFELEYYLKIEKDAILRMLGASVPARAGRKELQAG
jgi:AcrR family transcriptional regulator